ncbi:MAG: hypothetical protein BGN85_02355 [Alphaproteobacteria bacterium 64-11]|nr:hypothetical protein [Alphaproteobacteria bacterium]OJU13612.1 MAG: hypothetical protein BGN85_02355 [Alphaproteobacteria bacterium 64-11]
MNLTQFLFWLEHSPLGVFTRSLGAWSYGIVNLVHILGIVMLFGSILLLDLRLLGVWRSIPLAALSRPTVTLAMTGFFIAVASGIPMLAVKAGDYADNPFLLMKFPAIALALVNVWLLHRSGAWKAHRLRDLLPRERRRLALGASLSLAFWLTAITSGRMIGYW